MAKVALYIQEARAMSGASYNVNDIIDRFRQKELPTIDGYPTQIETTYQRESETIEIRMMLVEPATNRAVLVIRYDVTIKRLEEANIPLDSMIHDQLITLWHSLVREYCEAKLRKQSNTHQLKDKLSGKTR